MGADVILMSVRKIGIDTVMCGSLNTSFRSRQGAQNKNHVLTQEVQRVVFLDLDPPSHRDRMPRRHVCCVECVIIPSYIHVVL